MRRMVPVLAVAAFAVAGSFALASLPQPNTTGPSNGQRAIDGALWALGDQGTISTNPATTNTCPPANAAACQQIIVGVEGALVTAAANNVIGFVTNR